MTRLDMRMSHLYTDYPYSHVDKVGIKIFTSIYSIAINLDHYIYISFISC
jgi:hypothetical protein